MKSYQNDILNYQNENTIQKQNVFKFTQQYNELKQIYDNLEKESINSQIKYTTEMNDKILQLNHELKEAKLYISNLEFVKEELKEKILKYEENCLIHNTMITTLNEEVSTYKKLNLSLINKLKSMSNNNNNNDGREFLDSFEEVMRDELMTMKSAFEAKLKAARDEADELSRKHLVEINRLKSSNGFLTSSNSFGISSSNMTMTASSSENTTINGSSRSSVMSIPTGSSSSKIRQDTR